MAVRDRERWDDRHAVAGVGAPAPPDAVRGRPELLPAGGRALDVACGRGAVAVWLAGRGFTVDAVDVSPVGLAAGQELAGRHGVVAQWVEADLDAGLPPACAGPYDLVVCQRFLPPPGWRASLVEALAPGGLLVLTVLSQVGDTGGAFRAAPGALLALTGGLDVLEHREGDGEATLLARRPVSPGAPGSPPGPPDRS